MLNKYVASDATIIEKLAFSKLARSAAEAVEAKKRETEKLLCKWQVCWENKQ